MRLGIISDIHGNRRALDNVLAYLKNQSTDEIIFLGDAVGYLPFGIDVLTRLKNERIRCIIGNHEAMLLGRLPIKPENKDVYKLDSVKAELSPELLNFILSWEPAIEIAIDKKLYYFVHGSPNDLLTGYVYPDSDLSPYHDSKWDVIVMGHTHRPFLRREFGKLFVNPGSVGLPRDAGNLSSFAVIDTESLEVIHFRMEMDVDRLLTEIHSGSVHKTTVSCLRRISDKSILTGVVVSK